MNINKNNLFLGWAVIIVGITAVAAQVVLMRELAVIFYGNELSLGVMLGVWLFWTAVGSALLPRLRRTDAPPTPLHRIQILLVPLLPGMLWLLRSAKNALAISLGEMIGFTPMLLLTFITLAPICLINGFLYTAACRRFQSPNRSDAESVRRVYTLEAVGAGIGGILAGLLLITLQPAYTLIALSILNLFSVLFLTDEGANAEQGSIIGRWALLILAAALGFGLAGSYQRAADRFLWRGFDLVASRNTIHGNIVATRTGDLTSLYQNGILTTTVPEPLTAEESVHFALLAHPQPETVLLIGGGLGGGVPEVLKHSSIRRLDVVELDPAVYRMANRLFPPASMESVDDPRVTFHHTDGRRFLKTVSRTFDAVLINLPDPHTAQLNRFYTLEFFREVKTGLNPGGIFAFGVSSSENAVGPELADFLSIIDATLLGVFSDRVIIPGETARFIASTEPNRLTADPDTLVTRLQHRQIETRYVREYFIPFQLSRERRDYLRQRLRPVRREDWNRDFKPVGYYFNTILWSTTYSRAFKSLFVAFSRLSPLHIGGGIVLIFVFLACVLRRKEDSTGGVLASVASIGFSEITMQVIILLGFQILHGYVYALLSIIIAGYMVGLAIGSMTAGKAIGLHANAVSMFRRFQAAMALYPLFIAVSFFLLHRLSQSGLNEAWTIWIFPCLSAGAGFIGGMQFPIANRLVLRTGRRFGRVAGFLYGFDLLGSAAGALVTSAFLIPVFGVFPTLGLLALLNFSCWLLLMIKK